jgi:hypothetical protein
MALRNGHGRGAGVLRIEVLPADEQPAGVPAASGQPDPARIAALADVRRKPKGQVADSESAAILGSLGGKAKAEKERLEAEVPVLVQGLGLRNVTAADFLPYMKDAIEFDEYERGRLARTVGGGICEGGPATMVSSGALQLAGSRFSFAHGDLVMGSKLANDSRQNLMAATEMCAKEAVARRAVGVDPHRALVAALGGPSEARSPSDAGSTPAGRCDRD